MRLIDDTSRKIMNEYSPSPKGTAYSENCIYQSPAATKDISVIVPCYNVEQYVETCLMSILLQKTKYSFEVIAINDGSTDKTGAILQKLEHQFDHLRIVVQENKGVAAARNVGIGISAGKYLIFVDSDDYITEGYIENLLKAAMDNDADLVACGYYSFHNDTIYKHVQPNGKEDRKILNGCIWAKLFKRELFRHTLEPEGYWYEDSILVHLIYPQVKKVVTIDTCEYAYRSNPSGITISSRKKPKALDTIYITDLMIQTAEKYYGTQYIYSDSYYIILLNQFYLNQIRVCGLPQKYQKLVFEVQSVFITKYGNNDSIIPPERRLYLFAMRQNIYWLAKLAVMFDPLYKMINRIA